MPIDANVFILIIVSSDDKQDEIDSDDWISSSDESTESEIEEEEESFLWLFINDYIMILRCFLIRLDLKWNRGW